MERTSAFKDSLFNVNFLIDKRFRIYRHLLLACILTLTFVVSTEQNPYYAEPYTRQLKTYIALAICAIAYINMYVLVPSFLLKNKFSQYVLCLAAVLILLQLSIGCVIDRLSMFEQYTSERMFRPKATINIVLGLIFIAASTGIKLFQRWIEDTKRIGELTSASMQSELEQLKNQINPHFLFNMLNNANVLTQRDPSRASQVLMALSDLLRYQLYDCARNSVLLTSEIHFLNDFLNLEKIRRDDFIFTISKNGNLSGIQIPPFLFITFVENAVKHSLDNDKKSFVDIYIHVVNEKLNFSCTNSKPKYAAHKNAVGGLGLVNVKRRLDLLYQANHVLKIEETEELYIVNLTIPL